MSTAMGNEQCGGAKRRREVVPTVDDIMFYARIIMEKDPFKNRAPREEDRKFRALFGCGAHIVLLVWVKLDANDLLPEDGRMIHLLWTLLFYKTYAKWKTMKQLTGADPKTLRKWIRLFRTAIARLESSVVGLALLR